MYHTREMMSGIITHMSLPNGWYGCKATTSRGFLAFSLK